MLTCENSVNSKKILERQRVNQIMENICDYPLTILHAPMGYGKTSALKQFLQYRPMSYIWFNSSVIDSSSRVFWRRFVQCVKQVNISLGDKLQQIGFPENEAQLLKVLDLIIEHKSLEKNIIVIDNFHIINNPEIFHLIETLANEDIEHLHIVLLTRDISDVNIYNLVMKRLCFMIDYQILAFNKEEIKSYLTLAGFQESQSIIDELYNYTLGWILLINLEVSGLKKGLSIGITATIDDLIEKNFYDSYDEDTKQFLLKLAVFDEFTKEQVIDVLEEDHTYEMLLKLFNENPFIQYDNNHQTYNIHHVLLDYLRNKQKENPIEFKSLNKKAGKWHIKQGELEMALIYFYRADDITGVLYEIDHRNEVTLMNINQEIIFKAFDNLPQALWFNYPLAYLKFIRIQLLSGLDERVENGLQRLDVLQTFYENTNEGSLYKNKKRILAEIQISRIFNSYNHDVYRMYNYMENAIELLDEQSSSIDNMFGYPFILFTFFRESGKLNEITNVIAENYHKENAVFTGCSIASNYLILAEYALELGNLNDAKINAFKAKYQAAIDQKDYLYVNANFTIARLLLLEGSFSEVKELIRNLEMYVEEKNKFSLKTMLDICVGYIFGCLGVYNKIPRWIKIGDMHPYTSKRQVMTFRYIVQGKAILLTEDYKQLEQFCRSAQNHFARYNHQLGLLHNFIYEAVANQKLYGRQEAKDSLLKALIIGQADDIIVPFAENAPYILEMIKEISCEISSVDHHYLQRVIYSCNHYLENLDKFKVPTVSLTSREKEVLTLIADGLKRQEVAKKIDISIATVNKTLEHVYKKLEVGNKTSAIKKAKELKII
ncbi:MULTISPECIES: helix-turn-helix transcriptional regulator [Bacillus]|uniref:helix-turn-helix transcriptional regulator n=1 Tax=Bacillus TaxID=1386 RepID=UPI0002DFE700|nr:MULTISPECIES: LuxR C-terminal-related transcriptional regulator [Bacillus]